MPDQQKKTRILVFDVETTPIIGCTWGVWQQNVIRVLEDTHMLSFSYLWYGEDEVPAVVSQRQFKRAYKRNRKDDRQLIQALWELFDEADVVIAHNGDKFDIKKAQALFASHKLAKPSPFMSIDTLKIVRKQFNFSRNSLDYVCEKLGIGTKLPHTGFQLWLDCMAGDDEAWGLMERYNQHDIVLLVGLYEFLLKNGWIVNHPNVAAISGQIDSCPRCGGRDLMARGTRSTQAGQYKQYQCKDCQSYVRGRTMTKGTATTYR